MGYVIKIHFLKIQKLFFHHSFIHLEEMKKFIFFITFFSQYLFTVFSNRLLTFAITF